MNSALGDNFPGFISSCLRTPFEALEMAFSTLAQVVVIIQLLGTQENSLTLAALCLVRPLLSVFDRSILWGQSKLYQFFFSRNLTRHRYRSGVLCQQCGLSEALDDV